MTIKTGNLVLVSVCAVLCAVLACTNGFSLYWGLGIAVPVFLLLLTNKEWIALGIIASMFMEGHAFSFGVWGMRVRISQILELFAIGYIVVALLMNRIKLRRTPIDGILLLYVTVNIAAIVNSFWVSRGIKISALLFSLVILYLVVVNLIDTRHIFDKAFKVLLITGTVEILYGIYQVAAGMMNAFAGGNLPVGYLGVIHKEFIGSPWGRPYGTFVEPDWYGAVAMFFAIVFIALYYAKNGNETGRKYYFWGIIFSLMGLFFGFVRAAWLGFVGAAIMLMLLNQRFKLLKLNVYMFAKSIAIVTGIVISALLISPNLRSVIRERFASSTNLGASISTQNVRINQMLISFKSFMSSPVIGNGPGSSQYAYLYDETGNRDITEQENKGGFDPNVLLTVLEDTGLLGLLLFLMVLSGIYVNVNRGFGQLEGKYSAIVMGLFCGLFGLFVSYLFSQGLWLPFTWILLGLCFAALRVGRQTDHA